MAVAKKKPRRTLSRGLPSPKAKDRKPDKQDEKPTRKRGK
jgi:hypothetical protein